MHCHPIALNNGGRQKNESLHSSSVSNGVDNPFSQGKNVKSHE
jgi:hypothetical protein